MSKKIKIDSVENYDGVVIYETDEFEFKEGITILVGCNGSGKTTLMNKVYNVVEKDDIPCVKYYSNDKKEEMISSGTLSGNSDLLFAGIMNNYMSEGERIEYNFSKLVGTLGHFVYNECKEEGWVFVDSIDSGLSIDLIKDLKDFFINVMVGEKPDNLNLYVLIAANTYELARDIDCLDVSTGDYIRFSSYEEYSYFIMGSRKKKDNRK